MATPYGVITANDSPVVKRLFNKRSRDDRRATSIIYKKENHHGVDVNVIIMYLNLGKPICKRSQAMLEKDRDTLIIEAAAEFLDPADIADLRAVQRKSPTPSPPKSSSSSSASTSPDSKPQPPPNPKPKPPQPPKPKPPQPPQPPKPKPKPPQPPNAKPKPKPGPSSKPA